MGIERIFIVSKSGGLIYSYDNQTPVSLSELPSELANQNSLFRTIRINQ